MVPHDKQSPPVWIDLLPESRDIESDVTWARQTFYDSLTFGRDIFGELLTCEPCHPQLDAWCCEHIPGRVTVFRENLSEEYKANREKESVRCDALAREEADMREALLEPYMSVGFTLERKPPSYLLVSSWEDIPVFPFPSLNDEREASSFIELRVV